MVEGERTLDTAMKKELASEPAFSAFNQMLKIGKFAHSSSVDEKDVTHIIESRIIYRLKPSGPAEGVDGFGRLASQEPSLYLDPNEIARKMDKEAWMVARKIEADKDSHQVKTREAHQDDKKTEVAEAKVKGDGVPKAAGSDPPDH